MDKKFERLLKKGIKIIKEKRTMAKMNSLGVVGEVFHDIIIYNEKEYDIFYYEPSLMFCNKSQVGLDIPKIDEIGYFKTFNIDFDENDINQIKTKIRKGKEVISRIYTVANLVIDKQKELGLYEKKKYDIFTLISIYYFCFTDFFITEEEKMISTIYFIIEWIYERRNNNE